MQEVLAAGGHCSEEDFRQAAKKNVDLYVAAGSRTPPAGAKQSSGTHPEVGPAGRADEAETNDQGNSGYLRVMQNHRRARLRIDQAGARLRKVPAERSGAGGFGIGAGKRHAQCAQAMPGKVHPTLDTRIQAKSTPWPSLKQSLGPCSHLFGTCLRQC